MNKFLLATLSLALSAAFATAQTSTQHKCATELNFQKAAANNPQLLQEREDFFTAAAHAPVNTEKAVRIIPVVFHVIHENGSENISKAQIEDQIRILNEDFRRQNADASNTPAVWQGIAVDANIEFRLANIDPNGNCTDGIVRIQSPLTNGASDDSGVKALSYWNRQKYLNIWVVKSIDAMGSSGIVLGYAQLPVAFFPAATDGVVLRSDVVGSIGTALTGVDPSGKGRTATHEVGHWLGLRHIWGDTNCGTDGVADTPVHTTANNGCPLFPRINACNGNDPVNGEMFMNYMDYSSGSCQNLFTAGQKTIFDLTLTSVNFRATLITNANMTATGALNSPPNTCAPKAEFSAEELVVCQGTPITFNDESWNGTPTTWAWDFPGGTPSSSSQQNPTITYNTPGVYSITLTASNGAGSNSLTKTAYVYVGSTVADQQSVWNYTEAFEDQGYFDSKWVVINADNSSSFKWTRTANEGFSLSGAAKMTNYGGTGGRVDELISPSFNFNSITSPTLKFRVAYARVNNSANESLKVYLSSDCGQTWTQRYTKNSTSLVTVANQGTPFTPTDNSQWRQETVTVSNAFSNEDNVRIKFVFTSDDNGNNLFIDDINVMHPTGIDQAVADNLHFTTFPNPSNGDVTVSFNLIAKAKADIKLYDVVGKEIKQVYQGNLFTGGNQLTLSNADFPAPGVYMLQLMVDNNRFVKQIVITE